MNTLTLFIAYEIARDESHRFDFEIDSAQDADECQRWRIERDRRDRFIATLERVIKARLAPPRRRVRMVFVGYGAAQWTRTHQDAPRTYNITPASNIRLMRVLHEHMHCTSWSSASDASAWKREVPQ